LSFTDTAVASALKSFCCINYSYIVRAEKPITIREGLICSLLIDVCQEIVGKDVKGIKSYLTTQ